MGIVPLQYLPGDTADTLELTGKEVYDINLPVDLTTDEEVQIKVKFFELLGYRY